MKSYSVTIVFEDGEYNVNVRASNEVRAYSLALIDARMAHAGPVSYGRVVSKEVRCESATSAI